MCPQNLMRMAGCRDVATEVDEIEREVVMWTLQLMRLGECRDVSTEVDDIKGDVVMWPLLLMRLEKMSSCGHSS